ncbi:MAG TPA: protein kinase, partial [Polyangia bacterium]|nr:protein kinase [Polyangia bacterium]
NERDDLADADRAERAGDPIGAALALRRHLERHAGDGVARLRFARVLIAAGEHATARRALAPLEAQLENAGRRPGSGPLPGLPTERDVERALAELDEVDGAVAAAAGRWERLLADDIDDAQARARLARLRPTVPSPLRRESDHGGTAETLVSPEGVEALRYRLVREIGRGATATVYLARDEALDLSVALKILHPQLAGTRRTEPLGRFLTGARLLAGLRHPGVVAVYDVDEPARALAMEWIAGGTLRARLGAHPEGLPADEVATTARGLLSTLAFLHAQGIVHGDLKPSNLLLRAPGEVVLADFGGAVQLDREAKAARLGEAGGTPLYLAPEQFQGAPASGETDLYAAGAILWEAVTGRPLRSHADLLQRGRPEDEGASHMAPRAEAVAQLRARAPASAETILALLDPAPSRRQPRAWPAAPRRY